MEYVEVSLGERSYQIEIGTELLNNPVVFSAFKPNTHVVIISNTIVAPLYLIQLQQTLSQLDIKVSHFIFPDGERYKSLASVDELVGFLLEKQCGRDIVLMALGGGVIGDLVGFVAAIFQRGVQFIQIPTTLLAQVDSSVGGKTAVNHPLGKNMIGAFYQPKKVIIDLNTLMTLPDKQFSAGLAEVIKYGIILDGLFFKWLEDNIDLLLKRDNAALTQCIKRCCELKALVVAADEKEQVGFRELLNLGHTFGHAIETFFRYEDWLHGEAVAVGIVMAAELACRLGTLQSSDKERIAALLKKAQLPIKRPSNMQITDYIPLMLRDKKNLKGSMRFIVPTAIGKAQTITIDDKDMLSDVIAAC